MEGGGGRDSVLTLPPEVLKLTHQLEQEKLESLTRRYDVLRKENELLKTRLEKSAFLQRRKARAPLRGYARQVYDPRPRRP